MLIELTDLMESIAPSPTVLVIGDREYGVKDLTIAEMRRLSEFHALTDSEALDFLATFFGSEQPPIIQELRESIAAGEAANFHQRQSLAKQTALIVSAITAAIQNLTSNERLNKAIEQLGDRVRPPQDDDSDD